MATLTREEMLIAALNKAQGNTTKNRSVVCVLVGPGAAGKTTTARSLQNIEFSEERVSTRGGDRMDLLCQLDQDHVIVDKNAFVKVGGVNHTSRGLKVEDHAGDGQDFNAGREGYEFQSMVEAEARLQLDLPEVDDDEDNLIELDSDVTTEAKGRGRNRRRNKKVKDKSKEVDKNGTSSPRRRFSATQPQVAEKAQMTRAQQQVILASMDDSQAEGTHVNFFDMGGQLEFKSLVEGFLRSGNVICIFFTMTELLANLQNAQSLHPDDNYTGLEHFMSWCNSVVSTSSYGPVFLVGTYADAVPDQADRQTISDGIRRELAQRYHEIRDRIVAPSSNEPGASALYYFPVDNTRSGEDAGVQQLRAQLQDALNSSRIANMEVPLELRMWQDLINTLAYPVKEEAVMSAACHAIRQRHGRPLEGLGSITLRDLAELYDETFQTSQRTSTTDADFRKWVDAIHALGTITHFNSAHLENVVVLNPIEPLSYMTLLVRDFRLHRLALDNEVEFSDDFKLLRDEGVLVPELVRHFLGRASEADTRLRNLDEQQQQQILALMMQFKVAVPITYGTGAAYLLPGLLPQRQPTLVDQNIRPTEINEMIADVLKGSFFSLKYDILIGANDDILLP
ncbi:uncharacterized protein MONBRDRAFT_38201, partial [Monosiga brevicollis MX1]